MKIKVITAIAAPRDFDVGEEDWHVMCVFSDGTPEFDIISGLCQKLNDQEFLPLYGTSDFEINGRIVWHYEKVEIQ
jgi:hypothetical protein